MTCEQKLDAILSGLSSLNDNITTLSENMIILNTNVNTNFDDLPVVKTYCEHLITEVNSLVTNTSSSASDSQLIQSMAEFLGVNQ